MGSLRISQKVDVDERLLEFLCPANCEVLALLWFSLSPFRIHTERAGLGLGWGWAWARLICSLMAALM